MSKNFTKEQLRTIYEVCERKDLVGDWEKIAQTLNTRFGTEWGSSTYRKRYCWFKEMLDACQTIVPECTGDTTDLDVKRREFEQEKIKFRDERNAWNKQNYTDARASQMLDYLEESIKSENPVKLNVVLKESNNKKTAIVLCSDWHIGECFNNSWGKYDTEIAKQRVEKLLAETIKICERDLITNVVVCADGDLISGSIHRSIQVTNRENVIEQIMIASNLMKSFVEEFCKRGYTTSFINVAGNHTRLTDKNDAIKDERLDNLIGWFVNSHLQTYPNFNYIKSEESTLGEFTVSGNRYMLCHGDYDKFSESGLAKLVLARGYRPTAILYGHYHTFAVDDVANVKLIRGGSLCGSGDDYTVQCRLAGKPTQVVCVADENGINNFYNIVLG